MLHQTDHSGQQPDEQRHRKGDDDVAGGGEAVGEHARQVGEQDEHEQREDEGEVLPAFRPHVVSKHVRDKLVGHLSHRLSAARNEGAIARAQRQEQRNGRDGDEHPQRRVGEGDVDAADLEVDQTLDVELLKRAMCFRHRGPRSSLRTQPWPEPSAPGSSRMPATFRTLARGRPADPSIFPSGITGAVLPSRPVPLRGPGRAVALRFAFIDLVHRPFGEGIGIAYAGRRTK